MRSASGAPSAAEAPGHVLEADEEVAVRPGQPGPGQVDAARDPPRPAVAARLLACEVGLAERVDQPRFRIVERGQDGILVHHQLRARACDEARCRVVGGLGAHRTALRLPLLEAAVEHRGVIEAHHAQHPPHPGRPHHAVAAVEHDAGALADAVARHHGGELVCRQHHEVHRCVLARELARQVEEARAGDMAPLVVRAPPPGGRARRPRLRRPQIGGGLEHPEIGVAEMGREPRGRHQTAGVVVLDHGRFSPRFSPDLGFSLQAASPPWEKARR